MAASVKKAPNGTVESSSSEDEDLDRFREAVWDVGVTKKTDEGNNQPEPKPTRRLVVSDHQHDCNELQVTPEFRAHVAKKLEHMLDGVISEQAVSHKSSSTLEGDDLGFKLFATSIPGQEVNDTPCPVKRRRPVPSSSESDEEMEMRLREAAVSISDLLPPPSTAGEGTGEKVHVENPTEQNQEDETESPVPRKKKNKKKKKIKETCKEEGVETDSEEKNGPAEETHKNKRKRNRGKTSASKSVSDRSSVPSSQAACGELEEDGTQDKVRRRRRRRRKSAGVVVPVSEAKETVEDI